MFSDDMFTVTAIESLRIRSDRTGCPLHVVASLKPIAVVVKEKDRTYALDMDAQPLEIDRLHLPADFELA